MTSAAPAARSPIDFGRNFPPPSPLVSNYLARALMALIEEDHLAAAMRFPRFAGTTADREAGAQWLSKRFGAAPAADRVVLSNGTQSLILMLAAQLAGPGGTILTEAFTYPAVKALTGLVGVKLSGVAMDEEGLDPDALRAACQNQAARVLYCMPTVQNPTARIMSAERRQAIAEVARQYDLQIIEDDIYGLLPRDVPPPLANYAPERTWYLLGLSKSLASQLRVAYLVAPSAIEAEKKFWPGMRTTNWMVAPLPAEIATSWIAGGAANDLLDSVRMETQERQRLSAEILVDIPVQTHRSCYHLWVPLKDEDLASHVVDEARARHVVVGAGALFAVPPAGVQPGIRIGIGVPQDRTALRSGLEIIASLVREAAVI